MGNPHRNTCKLCGYEYTRCTCDPWEESPPPPSPLRGQPRPTCSKCQRIMGRTGVERRCMKGGTCQ